MSGRQVNEGREKCLVFLCFFVTQCYVSSCYSNFYCLRCWSIWCWFVQTQKVVIRERRAWGARWRAWLPTAHTKRRFEFPQAGLSKCATYWVEAVVLNENKHASLQFFKLACCAYIACFVTAIPSLCSRCLGDSRTSSTLRVLTTMCIRWLTTVRGSTFPCSRRVFMQFCLKSTT